MAAKPYGPEDDMREMMRADALHEAVKSFGRDGAQSTDVVIERANRFYDWLRARDAGEADNVTQLRAVD